MEFNVGSSDLGESRQCRSGGSRQRRGGESRQCRGGKNRLRRGGKSRLCRGSKSRQLRGDENRQRRGDESRHLVLGSGERGVAQPCLIRALTDTDGPPFGPGFAWAPPLHVSQCGRHPDKVRAPKKGGSLPATNQAAGVGGRGSRRRAIAGALAPGGGKQPVLTLSSDGGCWEV